jgi:general secretion pathway protein K
MSRRRRQGGAALLLAMMVVVLVVTTAAGMVWLQTRAVHVEAAERARSQAGWILVGATDWARLLLREDLRSGRQNGRNFDSLDEPWATRLEEARLSSFLAADKDNNADSGPEAFISGAISDAQSRYNLRSLVDASGKVVPLQVAALQRLVEQAGAPAGTADRIAQALAHSTTTGGPQGAGDAPLKPAQLMDLAWLGITPETIERLRPSVDLLPVATPVNVNTAAREVLVAAIDGLDLGTAERLVQARQRKPFETLEQVQALLSQDVRADAGRVAVGSNWFYVSGRLRLEDRAVEERSLVQREGDRVIVRRRERLSFAAEQR